MPVATKYVQISWPFVLSRGVLFGLHLMLFACRSDHWASIPVGFLWMCGSGLHGACGMNGFLGSGCNVAQGQPSLSQVILYVLVMSFDIFWHYIQGIEQSSVNGSWIMVQGQERALAPGPGPSQGVGRRRWAWGHGPLLALSH